jgi:hypothetical protein
MQAPQQSLWAVFAGPIATVVAALLAALLIWLKDLDSITRKSKMIELEKKRLEYWKLQSEMGAPGISLSEELRLSALRVGKLADQRKADLGQYLRHGFVAGGLIFGLWAIVSKAAVNWPNISAEAKGVLSLVSAALAFLGVSYAFTTLREFADTLFGDKAKSKSTGGSDKKAASSQH